MKKTMYVIWFNPRRKPLISHQFHVITTSKAKAIRAFRREKGKKWTIAEVEKR